MSTVAKQDPIRVMRELLAEARRNGHDFETAWEPAKRAALAVDCAEADRVAAAAALTSTKAAWRSFYNRSEATQPCFSLLAEACDGFPATAEITV